MPFNQAKIRQQIGDGDMKHTHQVIFMWKTCQAYC
jgi:hypothetical protein